MKFMIKINQILKFFEKLVLSWGMIALASVTTGNAISRRVFGRSWAFGEEFALFIMVIVTFIGISYAVREGRHIRMTAFFDQLSKKKQKYLMLFITFITAAVLFYLSYYSLLFTIRMRSLGRVTPALQIPYYLVVMWAPIGLFTGAIQYVLAFIKNIIEEGPWLSIETETEYLDPEDIKTTGI